MEEDTMIVKLRQDLKGRCTEAIEVGELQLPNYDFHNLKYQRCDRHFLTLKNEISGAMMEYSFRDIHVRRRLSYDRVIFYLLELSQEKKIAVNINL